MTILMGDKDECVEHFEVELNGDEPALLQYSDTGPMHTYCSRGKPRLFSNNASYSIVNSYPRFLRI